MFLLVVILFVIDDLNSKALIDSNISHDKFFSINNVQKECDHMKEETSNLKTSQVDCLI